MPTYPLPTLACTVDANGISSPQYADILASIQESTRTIFGSDIYIEPDSQDGELLATVAQAIYDGNQVDIAVFNSFSPAKATGVALSSNVKINGLQRESATNSTAVVTITGIVGSQINNGIAKDTNGNLWDLPSLVVIPLSGSIDVTATCETQGAISAAAGSINEPYTVMYGWYTVNNADPAIEGAPVELDGALRQRQAISTANEARTTDETLSGNIANLPGVTRSRVYVNDDTNPDINGIPGHSISAVIAGGDVTQICETIANKKDIGTGTYGSVSQLVTDDQGIPMLIRYAPLVPVPIYAQITIKVIGAYTSAIGAKIQQAVANFIGQPSAPAGGLEIGTDVYLQWISDVAGLSGTADGKTFVITQTLIGTSPGSLGTADIVLAYDHAATCDPANVAVVVTT